MNMTQDTDQNETQEWLDAFASLAEVEGLERAQYVLTQVNKAARAAGVTVPMVGQRYLPYVNSIPADEEPDYPGDLAIERRIEDMNAWNAVCMVLHATKKAKELGGHLSTFASASVLYTVGFLHFFKADDLVFFQGHASPGMYAQAFLEGRLTKENLSYFRQEISGKGKGLSSYPHPWLMPDFWQFATVSMGLGPIQGIYQAYFLNYLENRGLAKTAGRKVWVFCGDGEMDEPESRGAIHIAAKESLDNLIFVINCNLQRLNGPVRSDGHIISELEGSFLGADWNVIKVVWSTDWDRLLEKDKSGLLIKRMSEVVDGDYQTYKARDGAYIRQHFFGKHPELTALVADMTDDEIFALRRGARDPRKVFAAYDKAVKMNNGRPTVILAKSVKGYGLGQAGESQNVAHNAKTMTLDELKIYRDRFNIPVSDQQIDKLPFYHPGKSSKESKYLHAHRKTLGGYLPSRRQKAASLKVPTLDAFATHLKGTNGRAMSSTMVFVRILSTLLKDKTLGERIIAVTPDESRTFGMEGMYRQYGIYSSVGQLFEPEDKAQMAYYKESKTGQIFEDGLSEAGAMCIWMAAGLSYSTSNLQMIPFYLYYSMFGFQRTGDLAWASGDMQVRGFLVGGTAGRTTLAGEGLQHQDGHNIIFAGTIPNCKSYDPTYGYELAVIVQEGLHRMVEKQESIFYYVTIMNENYVHPAMPKNVEEGILKGLYLLKAGKKADLKVQLMSSGAILPEAEEAAKLLAADYGVSADVWSATSFNELAREGLDVVRWNRLHPAAKPKISYVEQCLAGRDGPVIAATDYIKLYADQIHQFVPQRYVVLGTDGFGRSDTRVQLRAHFEVDRFHIAYTAIKALADEGKLSSAQVAAAAKKYGIDAKKPNPLYS
jgi:pyruvate dehydrogenase E1 component